MMHIYLKENHVAMFSEGPISAPLLEHVEVNLTLEEVDRLKQNYPAVWDGTKLVFGEHIPLESGDETAKKSVLEELKERFKDLPSDKPLSAKDLQIVLETIAA